LDERSLGVWIHPIPIEALVLSKIVKSPMKCCPVGMDQILNILQPIEKMEIISLLEVLTVSRQNTPFSRVITSPYLLLVKLHLFQMGSSQEDLTSLDCQKIGRSRLAITFNSSFMSTFTKRKHTESRHKIVAETENAERYILI
jgi:hypothetical protein